MKLRRFIILVVTLSLVFFTIAGCGTKPNEGNVSSPPGSEQQDGPSQPDKKGKTSVLVAYFSCTNKTKGVAQRIAQATGGTLYEIVPKVPYTAADLNYNSDCRANREQHDSSARPEIEGKVENMESYDAVFLGYPIWWSEEPRIIDTFLESYDFSDKTLIPFCTSGGSGISASENNLHAIASDANWQEGMRFVSTVSQNEVNEWAEPFLNMLPKEADEKEPNDPDAAKRNSLMSDTVVILSMNGTDTKAYLYDTAAARSFLELLPLSLQVSRASDDLCGTVKENLTVDPLEDFNTWKIGEIGWFDGWFTILCGNEEGMRNRSRTILGKIYDEDIPFVQSLTGNVEIEITSKEPPTPDDPKDDPKTENSESGKAYTVSEDGTVFFGSYPQAQVTDGELIKALNAASKETDWTSFDYYISGEKKDFMFYQDVEYGSEKYRGVYFTEYRPNDTRSEGAKERSFSDDNGFETNTVYWFEYETLSWRILKRTNDSALLLCDRVIDSHEFYPAAKGEGGRKANSYQASSIREFLNESFERTAFSEFERTNLVGGGDQIFLLGYEDVTNPDYGFSSDETRIRQATDYARLQGLNMSGGARWWLNAENDVYDFYAGYVDGSGFAEYNQYVYFTSLGVVPALNIKLFDETNAPMEGDVSKDSEEEEMIDEIFLSINGHQISVKLEQNAATDALIELLKQGDLTYTASDYGGFEKVGNLGHSLPRSDVQMTAEAGDVILYLGDKIVLFYGSNSWSYTKLGKIQGISAEEWKEILTESNQITVKLSLR